MRVLAVKVQDIKDIGHHLDRFLRLRDIMAPPEAGESTDWNGIVFPSFIAMNLTVEDHIMIALH